MKAAPADILNAVMSLSRRQGCLFVVPECPNAISARHPYLSSQTLLFLSLEEFLCDEAMLKEARLA